MITYPLDLLADFPGWSTEFELMSRDEFSRTANGRTIPKNLGSPLWRTSYVTRSLAPNLLDEWRARLDALENGIQQFRAWPLSRCFPILYPKGTWPTGDAFTGTTAAVNSINSNRKSITLKGLPAGFTLRVGDMLQIGSRNLHRVQEVATANASGIAGAFEVRPHLWPEISVNDAVSVKKPSCLMTAVPGSISSAADPQTGRGSISFQAQEAR